MKKIITMVGIMLVLFGIAGYLFSYGDWMVLGGPEGYIEDWWFTEGDIEKNRSIDQLPKDWLGIDKWKVQFNNELDHGRYMVAFVSGNMEEIADGELDVVYAWPEFTESTKSFEEKVENSVMQEAKWIVTEYKEATTGAVSVTIYGKRRHIMDVIENMLDEDGIQEWNERLTEKNKK